MWLIFNLRIMAGKVAIVTGANKGIGLSIVRGLCKHLKNTDVYLTARNESLGLQAVFRFKQGGALPKIPPTGYHL